MFRALLLPTRKPDAPALLVVDTDRCETLGPPLLYLPEVETDVDTLLTDHGWTRRGPWWLNGSAAACEVTPAAAAANG